MLIRNQTNLGFSGGNNVGMRAATGNILILINQDTVVHKGWLQALVDTLHDSTVGMVGCKIYNPDGTIQHAGAYLSSGRGNGLHVGRDEKDNATFDQMCDVEYVTGACLALSRSTLTAVGFLDEGFNPAYYEDVDWCYRVKQAGLRVVYIPTARLTHHESTSLNVTSYERKTATQYGRLRFLCKHKPIAWLQNTFLEAEIAWLNSLGRTVEMMAVREAYLQIIFSLSDIVTFRLNTAGVALGQNPQHEADVLLNMLLKLRVACQPTQSLDALHTTLEHAESHAIGTAHIKTQSTKHTISEPENDTDKTESDDTIIELMPNELWTTLHNTWEINEQPFQSDKPVFGKTIVAIRQTWNSVSTRWYVLPILHQQRQFNATVTNLLTALGYNHANLARQQNDILHEKNVIALSQVEMMHLMEQILEVVEGQKRDIVQNTQEINTLTLKIIEQENQGIN